MHNNARNVRVRTFSSAGISYEDNNAFDASSHNFISPFSPPTNALSPSVERHLWFYFCNGIVSVLVKGRLDQP